MIFAGFEAEFYAIGKHRNGLDPTATRKAVTQRNTLMTVQCVANSTSTEADANYAWCHICVSWAVNDADQKGKPGHVLEIVVWWMS